MCSALHTINTVQTSWDWPCASHIHRIHREVVHASNALAEERSRLMVVLSENILALTQRKTYTIAEYIVQGSKSAV